MPAFTTCSWVAWSIHITYRDTAPTWERRLEKVRKATTAQPWLKIRILDILFGRATVWLPIRLRFLQWVEHQVWLDFWYVIRHADSHQTSMRESPRQPLRIGALKSIILAQATGRACSRNIDSGTHGAIPKHTRVNVKYATLPAYKRAWILRQLRIATALQLVSAVANLNVARTWIWFSLGCGLDNMLNTFDICLQAWYQIATDQAVLFSSKLSRHAFPSYIHSRL